MFSTCSVYALFINNSAAMSLYDSSRPSYYLDYCNAVLAGLPAATLAPLQRVLTGQSPDYITDLFTPVANILTRESQRVSTNGDLFLSRTERRTCDRAFSVAAPRACNNLVHGLKTELKLMRSSATTFERHLKPFRSARRTNYVMYFH